MFVLPLAYPLPRRAFHPVWSHAPQRRVDEPAPVALRPAMDAAESDAAYTLSFDLPGSTREQVQVTVEGREVRVEAAPVEPAAPEGARMLRRERQAPRYVRRVELPVEIDAAAAQARYDNGVLTLTLPKLVPTGARVVQVQ